MSSQDTKGGVASNCIDSVTTYPLCSHFNCHPYLCVSSGELVVTVTGYSVNKIVVYNRIDCCQERINNAKLTYSYDFAGSSIIYQSSFGTNTSSVYTFYVYEPSYKPTYQPSSQPSSQPSRQPSSQPSSQPSTRPSSQPSSIPSLQPSSTPSSTPSTQPSSLPSSRPSTQPLSSPSSQPSSHPSKKPSSQPSRQPSSQPSSQPLSQPSSQPSSQPTTHPSNQPTSQPTTSPTFALQSLISFNVIQSLQNCNDWSSNDAKYRLIFKKALALSIKLQIDNINITKISNSTTTITRHLNNWEPITLNQISLSLAG